MSWSDKSASTSAPVRFHIGSQDMFLEARLDRDPVERARSWTLPSRSAFAYSKPVGQQHSTARRSGSPGRRVLLFGNITHHDRRRWKE